MKDQEPIVVWIDELTELDPETMKRIYERCATTGEAWVYFTWPTPLPDSLPDDETSD